MPQRILLLEDEPSIADTVVYALTSEGFTAEVCSTLEAASRHLASGGFDLAIFDVGLPDGSGFELLKQLRQSSKLPVILLTARSEEIDRIVGLEIGADDYVVKPFSPRELVARVRSVLRRIEPTQKAAGSPLAESAPETHYGPFLLEPDKVQIRYFDEVLDLSRYEFRILEILLKRPGKVYSREQLMNIAWEEPGMSLERTIDAHIKSLRAKLRKINADQDPITTHRGFGYSLKEEV